jgi:hypothetical protein
MVNTIPKNKTPEFFLEFLSLRLFSYILVNSASNCEKSTRKKCKWDDENCKH